MPSFRSVLCFVNVRCCCVWTVEHCSVSGHGLCVALSVIALVVPLATFISTLIRMLVVFWVVCNNDFFLTQC
jgi:hypothetical protein